MIITALAMTVSAVVCIGVVVYTLVDTHRMDQEDTAAWKHAMGEDWPEDGV